MSAIANTQSFSGALGVSAPPTVLSFSTAGTGAVVHGFYGAALQTYTFGCNGAQGTLSYTFPNAFSALPATLVTTGSGLTITAISTTAITISGTVSSGNVCVMGI